MKKNLEITEILEKYICDLSEELHPVQKEIIKFNNSLGEIKKMQISEIQSFFLLFGKCKLFNKLLWEPCISSTTSGVKTSEGSP